MFSLQFLLPDLYLLVITWFFLPFLLLLPLLPLLPLLLFYLPSARPVWCHFSLQISLTQFQEVDALRKPC